MNVDDGRIARMIRNTANRYALLFMLTLPWASVSSFGQVNLSKEYIYLGDRILAVESFGAATPSSPANLQATAVGLTQINLNWSPPALGAPDHYGIWRRSGGELSRIGTAWAASYPDSAVAANHAYLYQVSAEDSSGQVLGWTNVDLATTVFFTDLVAQVTAVQALHVNELRTAVNAVRAAAGLGEASWTNPTLTGAWIQAIDVSELRFRLNEAVSTLGLTVPNYFDVSLPGITIKAVHFTELRQQVK
jgi:hypothetical protein